MSTGKTRGGQLYARRRQPYMSERPRETPPPMLSQKARYALRSLVELARQGPDQQLTAGEIAVRTDAPRKFLEAILLELSRRQIIVSRRGKFGGYVLARPPSQISFADVIRAIDGPLALAPCVSQMAFRKCDDCLDLETCALRPALLQARDATAAALEAYTLQAAADAVPDLPPPR